MRPTTIFLAFALVSVAAVPAAAQDATAEAEARSVFDAGQVAFTDARYDDALVYFKRSYRLSHRPALLFNIGLCHDRLRDDQSAIEAYERYLAEVPSAPNRREVDGRLEALHRAQRLRVAVNPANVVEADPRPPVVATTGTAPDSPAVYSTWWFWTIVGVLVVGSTVGIVVAASGDGPLLAGNVGGVVFTLGSDR